MTAVPIPAKFTDLITGKTITVFNRNNIGAMIHGDAIDRATGKTVASSSVFLIMEKADHPIGVRETETEVMALLGLAQNNKENV